MKIESWLHEHVRRQEYLDANSSVDLKMIGGSYRQRLRRAHSGADATTLVQGKAGPCAANATQQLQHYALLHDRRVNAVNVIEHLAVLERTIIASGGLYIGLETRAEMLVEHDVSAEPEKESAQLPGGLAECISRTRRAGSKCIQGTGAIEAGSAGRIVIAPKAGMDIQRVLCTGKWNEQSE